MTYQFFTLTCFKAVFFILYCTIFVVTGCKKNEYSNTCPEYISHGDTSSVYTDDFVYSGKVIDACGTHAFGFSKTTPNGDTWSLYNGYLSHYDPGTNSSLLYDVSSLVWGSHILDPCMFYEYYAELDISKDGTKLYITGNKKLIEWVISDDTTSIRNLQGVTLYELSPENESLISEIAVSLKTGDVFCTVGLGVVKLDKSNNKLVKVGSYTTASDLILDKDGEVWGTHSQSYFNDTYYSNSTMQWPQVNCETGENTVTNWFLCEDKMGAFPAFSEISNHDVLVRFSKTKANEYYVIGPSKSNGEPMVVHAKLNL
jgi:hypothetical protein